MGRREGKEGERERGKERRRRAKEHEVEWVDLGGVGGWVKHYQMEYIERIKVHFFLVI